MNLLKTNFFKNLSLSELGLVLLIPLASLSSRTWLPIPPTLLLFLGAALCLFFLQMQSRHSRDDGKNGGLRVEPAMTSPFKNVIAIFSAFVFYIFASQYFMGTDFFRYMGVIFAALYLVLILIFSQHSSSDFLKKLGEKFIRYSLFILCLEAVLRFAYGFYLIMQGENPEHSFYQFKFVGPMYVSSNMVAGHLVALLFFILWWGSSHKQSMKLEICIAVILLILTFSRASIPAVAIGLFYYFFFRNSDWKKSLVVLFSLGFFGLFLLWVLRYFPDYSFQTKFLILEETLYFYETASLKNILFGLGLSETETMARFTFSAHNYFLIFLLETGVFGLLFLLATFFILVKVTNGAIMIVLVPYFVQISAEAATFIPYFYVIAALMIIKTLNNDSKKNTLLLD